MTATLQLERLWRRLQNLFGHGRVEVGDDSGAVQLQQVTFAGGDVRDGTPRLAEYGFTSMPLPGCQALVLFIGGDRSNAAILATSDASNRLKNLQPGEVAIYDDQGQSVYLTRTGIVINGGGHPIALVNAPTVTHDGVNIGKTHVHGNVSSGTSNTGTPA